MITFADVHWPATLIPTGAMAQACHFDQSPDPSCLTYLPDRLKSAVPKRQAEFLAGRACAARAMARLGSCQTVVTIGADRAPVWPEGRVGSITHSDGFAAAIVSASTTCRGLGIDVERIMPDNDACPLMRQVGTEAEWALLTTRLTLGQAFALLFSAKEALYKAIYPIVQRFVGFTEVVCVSLDTDALVVTLPLDVREKLSKHDLTSINYVLSNDRVFTVCYLT